MAQAQLGSLLFLVHGATFDRLKSEQSFRWAARDRRDLEPMREFLGNDSKRISIHGFVIVTEPSQLSVIKSLTTVAEAGDELPFFLGGSNHHSGDFLDYWVVDNLTITKEILDGNATPSRIEFTINLSHSPANNE